MAMIRTYTETYDMNTEEDCPTLLGIHTPIGREPYRFLQPCFDMYQKYKYLGCDVTIVNAAKLPVDPAQMGKIEGENYIDPRDSLNPIMFKGCHGESLGKVLDGMYGGLASALFKDTSMDAEVMADVLSNFYYTALGDDSWRKSPVQKTLRIRGLHPLVYTLNTQMQLLPTEGLQSSEYDENSSARKFGSAQGAKQPGEWGASSEARGYPFNIPTGAFYDGSDRSWKFGVPATMFTGKKTGLGWLDTHQIIGQNQTDLTPSTSQIAMLPKCFMGLLMLPPANLCRQYLRVIIRHRFKFAKYRTITTGAPADGFNAAADSWGYYNHITGNVPEGTAKEARSEALSQASEDAVLDMEVVENEDCE